MTIYERTISIFDGLTAMESIFMVIALILFAILIRWMTEAVSELLSLWFKGHKTKRPPTPPTFSEIDGVKREKSADWYVSPNGEVRDKLHNETEA